MRRRKVFLFAEGKKNGEGKGLKYFEEKYLEKENIFFRGEVNQEGKGGKYLEKANIFCRGEENWRRKIYGEGKITSTNCPD